MSLRSFQVMTFSKTYDAWTDGQKRSFDLLYAEAKNVAKTLFGKIEYIGIPDDMTPSPIEAIFAVPISQDKFKLLFVSYDVEQPYYNADDFSAKRVVEDLGNREDIKVESIDDIIRPKSALQEAQHEGS